MQWYYAEGKTPVGPFNIFDFQKLVAEGIVQPDTLIWRSGMKQWQYYRRVPDAPGKAPLPPTSSPASLSEENEKAGQADAVCSQCGNPYPSEKMMSFEGKRICPDCQASFFQKIRQSALTVSEGTYGGFWIRFVAKFIDQTIITGIVTVFALLLMGTFTAEMSPDGIYVVIPSTNIFQFLLSTSYAAFFVGRFGATPGKMVCRLEVVTSDGSGVGYGRALGRALAEVLSAMIFFLGYIMAAFDVEKRTLHDRLCDTRVIKK